MIIRVYPPPTWTFPIHPIPLDFQPLPSLCNIQMCLSVKGVVNHWYVLVKTNFYIFFWLEIYLPHTWLPISLSSSYFTFLSRTLVDRLVVFTVNTSLHRATTYGSVCSCLDIGGGGCILLAWVNSTGRLTQHLWVAPIFTPLYSAYNRYVFLWCFVVILFVFLG